MCLVSNWKDLITFAGGREAADTECPSEHKVPAFVNPEFTVASGRDGSCHYRGKILEPGRDGFRAKAIVNKQDKSYSSYLDSASKCL